MRTLFVASTLIFSLTQTALIGSIFSCNSNINKPLQSSSLEKFNISGATFDPPDDGKPKDSAGGASRLNLQSQPHPSV